MGSNFLKRKTHRPHDYPSWVFEAYERRAAADALGELYQKGSGSESPPGERGSRRRRPAGGRHRVDRDETSEMRKVFVADRQGSCSPTDASMERSEGSRPGAGAELR